MTIQELTNPEVLKELYRASCDFMMHVVLLALSYGFVGYILYHHYKEGQEE